ncbi:MAG: nucleotidyltransferase domain-containing protein [Nanoarchaeota archaeon]
MIQKDYLKFLESKSKSFEKDKGIFDIVVYGSNVKGKIEARDIDILIIFKEKPLAERVEITQRFKEKIGKEIGKLDIKTINLSELFETNFLARQAILTEGYSLINRIPFSEKIGFLSYSLFTYKLKNLSHNDKTKFTYSLIGRGKNQGILKKLNAKPLGKAVILLPIQNSSFFEDFLKKWKIDYNKKNILISEL